MPCRLHVFNGMSFLLAKVYYHFSTTKTDLNISILAVRHIKTTLKRGSDSSMATGTNGHRLITLRCSTCAIA